jgi:hypothetical protein
LTFIISPALSVPNKKLRIRGKAWFKGVIALKYAGYSKGVNLLVKDVLMGGIAFLVVVCTLILDTLT